MPHLHTKPGQHDLVVSAFIIRTDGNEPQAMLHMHKKLKRWMQFGGHVELHETPWQAITHELLEEAGYDLDQLKLLQPKLRIKNLRGGVLHPVPVCINTHNMPDNHKHTDIEYVFIANEAPRHSPEDGESTEIKLFTAAELRALPARQSGGNVQDLFLQIMENFLNQWEAVDPTDFQL